MKKKNCAIFEIVCYVVAVVMGLIGIYMLYENISYINEYLTAYGMTFSDIKGDIMQTVFSVFAPYFTYAFVAFGIGKIYHQVAAPKCAACEPVAEIAEEPVAVVAEAVEDEEMTEELVEEVIEMVEAEVIGVAEEAVETVEEPKED